VTPATQALLMERSFVPATQRGGQGMIADSSTIEGGFTMGQKRAENSRSTHFPLASILPVLMIFLCVASLAAQSASAPTPLLKSGQSVDWWFVFKFNAESFPGCGGAERACLFGGTVQPYREFSQQFAYASSADHTLRQGGSCVGDTTTDPLGATVNEVYNGEFFYVLWNDQFYGDPINTESAPAGHSKGMLAWNEDGNGFVLQVSTPSWPASGSSKNPRRTDGNTLGCVKDNDVLVSQHFFALKLNRTMWSRS
jgi:hypothetical protein